MIKILTDTSCDMDPKMCKELGIEVLPIQVHFGDIAYTPNVDISINEFYDKLQTTEKLPTTTQINPIIFEEEFAKHISNGDEVLGMFISKELSGTYQNAVLCAQKINPEKIHIVDTLNTTFGLSLLLIIAAEMRDKGICAHSIKEKIEELVPRLTLYASIDTLKYLKMGGRLSSGAAIVAGILGILPIISVQNGKVCAIGKARGREASFKFINDNINKLGISSDYPVALGHSNSTNTLKMGEDYFTKQLTKRKVYKMNIGAVIGTHIGPGAFGIAFIKK